MQKHSNYYGSFNFFGTCVSLGDGDAINEMKDGSKEIVRRTFLKYVNRDELAKLEKQLGYERGNLTMAQDWHVSYHKGVYNGKLCVYFRHSCIEHVFVV